MDEEEFNLELVTKERDGIPTVSVSTEVKYNTTIIRYGDVLFYTISLYSLQVFVTFKTYPIYTNLWTFLLALYQIQYIPICKTL